jgi:hypothetical protein
MEIAKFISADEDYSFTNKTNEGFQVIDSSGTKNKKIDTANPNIISFLNNYGDSGWEVISVREIERNHEELKVYGVIETYTLKRKITYF